MSGLGSFRTITTTTANITTDNVTTLNVSGTATITKLSINSTMRSNNDLFNCSTSSTGPYLFIANDATIGTYNTNNSTFPWFVEMDGDATFQTVNCNNYLFGQQLISAYILNGTRTSGFAKSPIICSEYKLMSSNLDDIFIVYPRYKLIVYYNAGYTGTSATINNYTGTSPLYITSVSLYGTNNRINSCRLYYLNDSNEITNVLIS